MNAKTSAITLMIALLFAAPTLQIVQMLYEYGEVSTRVEGLNQETATVLESSLLERKPSPISSLIRNLFAAEQAPPTAPVETRVSEPPKPSRQSLSDLFQGFSDRIDNTVRQLKIPEPPKFDLSKLSLRGFFRKNKTAKAVVVWNGKLLLIKSGDRIDDNILLENCDFTHENITIRIVSTGEKIRVKR